MLYIKAEEHFMIDPRIRYQRLDRQTWQTKIEWLKSDLVPLFLEQYSRCALLSFVADGCIDKNYWIQ